MYILEAEVRVRKTYKSLEDLELDIAKLKLREAFVRQSMLSEEESMDIKINAKRMVQQTT